MGGVLNLPEIDGYCPMGCGRTLVLEATGAVTCTWFSCPDPDAVAKLLAVPPEVDHVVEFHPDDTFTLVHPIRERIDRPDLTSCEVFTDLVALPCPPVGPGRYRVETQTGTDNRPVLVFREIETGETNGDMENGS